MMMNFNHAFRKPLFSFCSILLFSSGTNGQAFTSFTASNNVAVYWGQNSYGQASGNLSQQKLSTYCANSDIDIIPMAFMVQVNSGPGNTPVLNFANQQNDCDTFTGTNLINCPSIGDDIKTCQQQYGKKILLSIGGATYTEGGFASSADATTAAENIWQMFGPQTSSSAASNLSSLATISRRHPHGHAPHRKRQSTVLRPFGDAVLDGFDFDFESPVTNIVPFASRLRTLMDADSSKQHFLTAAPQCPYPDLADDSLLSSNVSMDAVFVQFYNNYCGSNSYVKTVANQTTFDFNTWNNWATTISANKNVKVFLGVPANTGAAGTGYLDATSLEPVIEYSKTFPSFGGVMMWDASQAYANTGFLSAVKSAVGGASSSTKRGVERKVRLDRKVPKAWKA